MKTPFSRIFQTRLLEKRHPPRKNKPKTCIFQFSDWQQIRKMHRLGAQHVFSPSRKEENECVGVRNQPNSCIFPCRRPLAFSGLGGRENARNGCFQCGKMQEMAVSRYFPKGAKTTLGRERTKIMQNHVFPPSVEGNSWSGGKARVRSSS